MSEFRQILLILLGISLLTGTVSAGAFIIDTEGITASAGSTVQIPVRVEDAESLSACQLLINTGETNTAVISVNTASASGMTYSDETGILIWAGALKGETITGERTLFLLDVTPKNGEPIPLSVQVTQTFTGLNPAVQIENYAGYRTILQIGENTGGGESVQPAPTPEISASPSPEKPSKPAIPATESAEETESPVYPMPSVTDTKKEEAGFSLPYWVIIILAVSAFLLITAVLKKQ